MPNFSGRTGAKPFASTSEFHLHVGTDLPFAAAILSKVPVKV